MKQKRRIYDITNVLEGVGLIEKKNKNIIQWRFAVILELFHFSTVIKFMHELDARTTGPHGPSSLSLALCLCTRDENSGCQPQEVMDQVKLLKAQISELETRERELDSQRALLEESIHFLNHDPLTRAYPLFFSNASFSSFSCTLLVMLQCVCWNINICDCSFQIDY